jgi:hypothetical protein
MLAGPHGQVQAEILSRHGRIALELCPVAFACRMVSASAPARIGIRDRVMDATTVSLAVRVDRPRDAGQISIQALNPADGSLGIFHANLHSADLRFWNPADGSLRMFHANLHTQMTYALESRRRESEDVSRQPRQP